MNRKVGRNEPYPCESSIKYKKCCGRTTPISHPPPEIIQHLIKNHQTRQKYGDVRPIISNDFKGYKMVAVGNQMHYSKNWKTVHDFLFDYIKNCLGSDWGSAELQKDSFEMHPILQWYRELCIFQKKHFVQKGLIHEADCTGPVGAYLSLAYDLYILRHHSLLQKSLIKRIKNKDQFQGARYELYVAASFIKAGFKMEFEDEADRSKSHCEFVATHSASKKKYSIEAKSRHRPGFLGYQGEKQDLKQIRLRIGGLLNNALEKQAGHTRIIFLDVNMPPEEEKDFKMTWFKPLIKIISQIENQQKEKGASIPAYLFFTNHPYHYVGKSDIEPSKNFFLTAINIPSFRKNDINAAKKEDPTIFSLWDSVNRHTKVPHDFNEY